MSKVAMFIMNETMVFLTIIVVFPGVFPPKNKMELVMCVMLMFSMSFI